MAIEKPASNGLKELFLQHKQLSFIYSLMKITLSVLEGNQLLTFLTALTQALSLNVAIEPIAQSQSDPGGPRLAEEFGR